MKPRRKLEKGEKVVFQDIHEQLWTGVVFYNYEATLLYEIDVNGRLFKNVHRRQVLATFKKKKKEKPLIVWVSESAIENLKLGHSGTVYPESVSNLKINLVPCRRLTKRERERWGV